MVYRILIDILKSLVSTSTLTLLKIVNKYEDDTPFTIFQGNLTLPLGILVNYITKFGA